MRKSNLEEILKNGRSNIDALRPKDRSTKCVKSPTYGHSFDEVQYLADVYGFILSEAIQRQFMFVTKEGDRECEHIMTNYEYTGFYNALYVKEKQLIRNKELKEQ